MENTTPRKWYQKKRYIIPLATFAIATLINLASNDSSSTPPASQNTGAQQQVKSDTVVIPAHQQPLNVIQEQPTAANQNASTSTVTATPTTTSTVTPTPTPTPTPTAQAPQPTPSYYTNSDGNKIQSPTQYPDNSVPAGATARCADGSYSFSQHRSGTCSHHGGVAEWF